MTPSWDATLAEEARATAAVLAAAAGVAVGPSSPNATMPEQLRESKKAVQAQGTLVHEIMTEGPRNSINAETGSRMPGADGSAFRNCRRPPCRRTGQCHWLLSICDGLGQIVGEEEHVIHDLETERLEMTTRRDRFELSERRDPRLLRPERRVIRIARRGKPHLGEEPTLEELVVLAIAVAIVGEVPMVHHAPVLHVDLSA